MTPGLSQAERALLERAHRQRYKLARAPRFQPLPKDRPATATAGPALEKSSRRRLLALAKPPFAVRVLNNMSYGATTTSIAEFNALGTGDPARLTAWVDRQLDPASIDDAAVDARLAAAGYYTLDKTLAQQWSEHVRAEGIEWGVRMRPGFEVQREALVRAVYSKRQLFEVVTGFWHDHFNVMVSDYDCCPVYGHYDRDVIRANAFGNFRTMLEAVAKSPAMMIYLDNKSNRRSGPNENFARELLELHTFGAENYLGFMDPFEVPPCPEDRNYPIGYTDIDVYETAAAFTGWTMNNNHWEFQHANKDDGHFYYHADWHDSGPKFVLGTFIYPERPALQDGRDILDRIASHPRVARFICRKLARRFLGDDPPQALVDSAAAVFRANWQAPDQIRKTLRHILLSDVAQHAWGRKVRRPFEAVAASLRVLGCDWTYTLDENRSNDLNWRLGFTGHQPYDWPAPNGYPDLATAWSGASTFGMTWKLLNWLTETNNVAGDGKLLPIMETTRAGVPAGQWTANRLVEFWCRRILGYMPKSQRVSTLRAFLAQDGDPASYVIEDTNGWNQNDLKRHYNQERIRSMVSLILMSPEFLSR
ncbi:DUF1800 domain-containing protein [Luteimonas viscosa]|uniref:DUF1800 domain-containing protein n=1 Tax=Luteimonas viscosa TaxID=1132694 RepID=A0A5D4XQ95_9GAMM|nr:DUF1800 domain-containing protein [Luteimonas viscosa]TYT25102.1 DUF1800 domain-containing protein [Luteimonas viscosa]